MKISVVLALAAAKLIAGHSTFQSIVIDGKDQGQHFAVQTPSNGNNPIKDVTSPSMVCNGGTQTSDFVDIAAGSKIGLQWHHNDPKTDDSDEPIAASHKGPVMVYIAPAEGNGEGAVWTKIYEDGFSNGKWGVDNFITNKGLIEVTLPDLADGNYLIRPEIIGLHEANNQGGAQFYNGCGQLKISGGSTSLPSSGVDMTKAYSATDPGVLINIYYPEVTSYEVPGPAVWDGASSGSGSSPAPPTPTSSSVPTSSSAPTSSAAPTSSSAPSYTSVPATPSNPVQYAPQPTTSTPASGSGSGSGSGSSLPEIFTIDEFIAWLKQQTGSSAKARRHARQFEF